MREPLTEELLNELLSSPDPNSFLSSANPSSRSLAEYLQQLLDEKGLERSKVVREAGLNDTFGYQIFKALRYAAMNRILQRKVYLDEATGLPNKNKCEELLGAPDPPAS